MELVQSVGRSWRQIVLWFERESPNELAKFRGPAEEAGILAVEQALGSSLPADQSAWWRLVDGVDDSSFVNLIPGVYAPLSVTESLANYRLMINFAPPEPVLSQLSLERAGSPCYGFWLPAWLPIAHNHGGSFLFLDLRHGPRFGCVGSHRKDEWLYENPKWPSVKVMLEGIADGLANGVEVDRWYAVVEDGCLTWLLS